MAVDYAALFADLGKIVKHYDLQKTDATDLAADLAEILAVLQSSPAINGPQAALVSNFAAWQLQHQGRRSALVSAASSRLLDKTTILDELNWTGGSIDELLRLLRLNMLGASESINASVVTLGSVSADAGNNASDAVLMTTKVLDGAQSPGQISGRTVRADAEYAGLNSELCVPADTITVECVADSESGGAREGGEAFNVYGSQTDNADGVAAEGFGSGSLRGLHAAEILTNGDFETGASNTPTGWNVVAGTPGTHIFWDTGQFFHGVGCLRFLAASSPALLSVNQSIALSRLRRNQMYCLAFRYKGEAGIASGDLSVHLEDNTGTIGTAVTVNAAGLAAATSWTHAFGFVLIPAYLQTQVNLHIVWSPNPTLNKNLRIDDIAFGPVTYLGGLGLAWRRGGDTNVALAGDRWTFDVSNSEGVFQRFFRRGFGVQMPSNNAGTETRADSLAT